MKNIMKIDIYTLLLFLELLNTNSCQFFINCFVNSCIYPDLVRLYPQLNKRMEYRVRQRGCSLTHSARTPPAVHPGIMIWVDEIEFEKKLFFEIIVFGGGSLTPFFFCANLLVRVKLGYPPNFNFLGKPLLVEKYVHGKKKKEEEQ